MRNRLAMLIVLALALALALPLAARGEGADVLVETFIQRTGIQADAALREKIGTFLREKYITPQVLDMIDDALLQSYARHLSEGLPIDYAALLDDPSQPMPEGAKVLQLAVLLPQGATMESLLADFERGLVYYDENWPVPQDVCRAQYAGTLSDAAAAALLIFCRLPVSVSGSTLATWLRSCSSRCLDSSSCLPSSLTCASSCCARTVCSCAELSSRRRFSVSARNWSRRWMM